MKNYLAILAVIALSCNNAATNNTTTDTTIATRVAATPTVKADKLITPGAGIGKLYLGQDVQELGTLLGNADDGDAAMGKAWGIWHLKGGDISVYSSYKDSTATGKDIKQIAVSDTIYQTKEGLGRGATIEKIRSVFPAIQRVVSYVHQGTADTLYVYDEVQQGIAFDMVRKGDVYVSTAITVHPRNIPANSTYLTIHPGWEPLQ